MNVTAVPRKFCYNPQDSVVLPAGTTTLTGVTSEVATDQVRLLGGLTPNAQGDYIYGPHDKGFHGANAFASTVKTLETFQRAYGEPIQWATGKRQLELHADDGEMLNAYYDRRNGGLFFFHSTDPVTKQVVHGADSGEVTSHECGHALLDAVRPGYFSSWGTDPPGFHESFGDVIAMLRALQEPAVLQKVAEQTGGDLRKANLAAALGEELGITINHTAGHNATGGDFTRNAIHDFVWQDPKTLPKNAPPDKLAREPHSWSRLWTGAVYDLLGAMTRENLAAQATPDVAGALGKAADELLEMYGRLMKVAPTGDFTFRQMAAAFVRSDEQLNGGKRSGLIRKVFTDRKILSSELAIRSQAAPEGNHPLRIRLDSESLGRFSGATVETVLSGSAGFQDQLAAHELSQSVQEAIQDGEILYTNPGQTLELRDLVKSDGQPYLGVLVWDQQGQKHIERVGVAN